MQEYAGDYNLLDDELNNFIPNRYWASKVLISAETLKSVEFIGYSLFTTELARFLLRHAKNLEHMHFRKTENDCAKWQRHFGRLEYFFDVVCLLLSYPRASPRVKILLV